MRYWVGAPIAHHIYGGVGVGRYGRHVPTVRYQRYPSPWLGVFAILVGAAVLVTYWYIFLAIAAVMVFAAAHKTSEVPTKAMPLPSTPKTLCWVKGCRHLGLWKITLTNTKTGRASDAMVCEVHLDALSKHLPLKEQYRTGGDR